LTAGFWTIEIAFKIPEFELR